MQRNSWERAATWGEHLVVHEEAVAEHDDGAAASGVLVEDALIVDVGKGHGPKLTPAPVPGHGCGRAQMAGSAKGLGPAPSSALITGMTALLRARRGMAWG